MRNAKSTLLPPWATRLALALVGIGAAMAINAPEADACPSCNRIFAQSILNERADTLAGRDILNAMENQRGLPLRGFVTEEAAELSALRADGPVAAADTTDNVVAQAEGAAAAAPAAGAPSRDFDTLFGGADFIEIIRRDEAMDLHSTSFVPQDTEPDKSFTIVLDEGDVYIGQGVLYEGFTTDGGIPGQTIIVTEGDIVELVIDNQGAIPHGASIHAAYTATSKYVGYIEPGESKSVTFRATVPGVYMYHCAPGGHAIPMHVMFGQYGMIVVEPKDAKYRLEEELGHGPDVNLYIIQHELYESGADAIGGNYLYSMFNGKLFGYVEEPITAKPGDYVRIHYLNVGPNNVSTFHIVGIIWDYVYWQGHPEAIRVGGQTITSAPSDSWIIEFRVPPDEGAYTILDHAVGASTRGAIGVLAADRDADTPLTILAEGPVHTPEERAQMREEAVRIVSPFGIGRNTISDLPVVFGPDIDEVTVSIIGNSYHPKVIEIEPGTTVRFVNEDVFTYLAGEFAGIHNAIGVSGPEPFATPLLAHAESATATFNEPGVNDYICTPHPYMTGRIIVREPAQVETAGGCSAAGTNPPVGAAVFMVAMLGAFAWRRRREDN